MNLKEIIKDAKGVIRWISFGLGVLAAFPFLLLSSLFFVKLGPYRTYKRKRSGFFR